MFRRIGIRLLCVVAVCLGLLACQKLSTSNPTLKIEPIRSTAAISAEYGNLIGVTTSNPNAALMWFQKPDKSIVVVGVNLGSGTAGLAGDVIVIPRN